jgi:Cu2+-exporting ATPase
MSLHTCSTLFLHRKAENTLQVVEAIELSRATIHKVKQNLGWALTYNAIAIPLAAGALLPKYGFSMSPSVAGV